MRRHDNSVENTLLCDKNEPSTPPISITTPCVIPQKNSSKASKPSPSLPRYTVLNIKFAACFINFCILFSSSFSSFCFDRCLCRWCLFASLFSLVKFFVSPITKSIIWVLDFISNDELLELPLLKNTNKSKNVIIFIELK